jgi:hypothetical protein
MACHIHEKEGIMKRVLLLLAAMSVCLIALALRAQDQLLVTRVDHVYVASDQAQALFNFFKDTFQLPESWPFRDAETHTSGGLWLGNTVLEFLSAHGGDKPVKTEFRGIAFEPTGGADETVAELTKRDIAHAEVENRMRKGSDGQTRVVWSIVHLKNFPPIEADVFFVDYKHRKSVAARYQALDEELTARNRGPLGIVSAAEITVGVQDLDEARRKWSVLVAPSPLTSDDAFVFDSGPRIRLVQAESPGIQGIVLKVRSLDRTAKFMEKCGLLAKDDSGGIAISPAAIGGLSIRLIDDSQAEEPGETREAKYLGAKGREVKAGKGSLLVLESVDDKGVLSGFLSNHKDGSIIGISIEVSDLNKARSWAEGHSRHKLGPYGGFYGRSIAIPPDLTHGIWLELFRR